jgi:hypothetical protein
MLVMVYLALCSTIMASAVERPGVETRVTKAKAVPAKAAVKPKPVAVKPAPKTVAQPKPAAKPAAKPVAKSKADAKPAVKPVAPPVVKPAAKPVATPKAVAKPAVKPVAKPAVKPVATPKGAAKPAVKPVAKPVAKPAVKPAATPKAAAKSAVKPVASAVKPSASKKSPTKSASSAVPSSSALFCVAPTPTKAARNVGDKVPNQFIVSLKAGVNRAKHIASVKALIVEGAKCDKTKSSITLDGPAFAKLPFYGGIFGPSVLSAIKKSPDVKSVVGNTLLEVDSPIPVTSSLAGTMTKRALLFDNANKRLGPRAPQHQDEDCHHRDLSGRLQWRGKCKEPRHSKLAVHQHSQRWKGDQRIHH